MQYLFHSVSVKWYWYAKCAVCIRYYVLVNISYIFFSLISVLVLRDNTQKSDHPFLNDRAYSERPYCSDQQPA